jgi:hypothetical protein
VLVRLGDNAIEVASPEQIGACVGTAEKSGIGFTLTET